MNQVPYLDLEPLLDRAEPDLLDFFDASELLLDDAAEPERLREFLDPECLEALETERERFGDSCSSSEPKES